MAAGCSAASDSSPCIAPAAPVSIPAVCPARNTCETIERVSAHGEAAEPRGILRAESAPAAAGRARAVLGAASSIHFIHDGFSDVIYVLLPVWASQFGLTFAQVGLLRTVYSAGMAAFQIPA